MHSHLPGSSFPKGKSSHSALHELGALSTCNQLVTPRPPFILFSSSSNLLIKSVTSDLKP
ncbi:hypothetical protein Mapa_002403 [Marchantia paleacea]|nr:hypothetical protein Mapa_002403 [Marchantia paleacea]